MTYPKFKNGEAIVQDVRVAQNFGKLTSKVMLVSL